MLVGDSCDGLFFFFFFFFFLKPTDVSEANIVEASYSLVLRTLRGLELYACLGRCPNTATGCSFILSARLPTFGIQFPTAT